MLQASGWRGAELCSEVAGHSLPVQMTWLCLHGEKMKVGLLVLFVKAESLLLGSLGA